MNGISKRRARDDDLPVRSQVSTENGFATVQVSEQGQRASGIATQEIEEGSSRASVEIYGIVVNIQPLLDSARALRDGDFRSACIACGRRQQRSRVSPRQEIVRTGPQRVRARGAGGAGAMERRSGACRRCRPGDLGGARQHPRGIRRRIGEMGDESGIGSVRSAGPAAPSAGAARVPVRHAGTGRQGRR